MPTQATTAALKVKLPSLVLLAARPERPPVLLSDNTMEMTPKTMTTGTAISARMLSALMPLRATRVQMTTQTKAAAMGGTVGKRAWTVCPTRPASTANQPMEVKATMKTITQLPASPKE